MKPLVTQWQSAGMGCVTASARISVQTTTTTSSSSSSSSSSRGSDPLMQIVRPKRQNEPV